MEADPKTVRKCDSAGQHADDGHCPQALSGANSMVVCRCSADLCNGAHHNHRGAHEGGLVLIAGLLLRGCFTF